MGIMDKVNLVRTCNTYKKRWESAVAKIEEAWTNDDPDTIRYYSKVANDYLKKYLDLKYGSK